MQGRRAYPPPPDEDIPHPLPLDCKPGDYWFDPTQGVWFICPPSGSVGSLANHEVVENPDGTITVSPSILVTSSWQPQHNWHGYLENGIWREV